MDLVEDSRLSTVYRMGYVCLLVVSVASFLSLFEPDTPIPKKKKSGKRPKPDIRQSWPMLLNFNAKTKKNSADTEINEGLRGGQVSPVKLSKEQNATQENGITQLLSQEDEKSHIIQSTSSTNSFTYSGDSTPEKTTKQEEVAILQLQGELERLRSQIKRESELRVIAEDNLQLCQVQLRKEQETVLVLRKKVLGLENKLSTSQNDQKVLDCEE